MVAEWVPQASFSFDIDQDGNKEAIFPMSKGYASGIDGTTPFIALSLKDGDLFFDNIINELMPNTIAARHYDYIKIAGTNSLSVITTHTTTDTESNRNENSKIPPGELNLIQDINAENNREF